MLKKSFVAALAVLFLCVMLSIAQTARRTAPRTIPRIAAAALKPGYYFTIDMCRACYYPKWQQDLTRELKQAQLPSLISEGFWAETREAFAPFKSSDRRGIYGEYIYLGPFASEQLALAALEKLPPALSLVQQKRNRMDGAGGWDLRRGERVRRANGNRYEFGFYEINGYRVTS